MHVCMHVSMYLCIYVHVCICMRIFYVYMNVNVCENIYMYMHVYLKCIRGSKAHVRAVTIRWSFTMPTERIGTWCRREEGW